MKKDELRTLLNAAAIKQQSRAIGLAGDDNPQVVASYRETLATYTTLQAVIEALDAPRAGAAYDLQLLTR